MVAPSVLTCQIMVVTCLASSDSPTIALPRPTRIVKFGHAPSFPTGPASPRVDPSAGARSPDYECVLAHDLHHEPQSPSHQLVLLQRDLNPLCYSSLMFSSATRSSAVIGFSTCGFVVNTSCESSRLVACSVSNYIPHLPHTGP
ncbi:hypothetical protein BJY52DRAFT_1341199 [Lactarius psammicola]|nr:hypothetical protein BJY52DRAFT_1341199 [Lactarius psammicola]